MRYGGIEFGGTKIVYGISDETGLLDRQQIPTDTPDIVFAKLVSYFQKQNIQSLGIAAFGPIDLESGIITTTPKPHWANVNLRNAFASLSVPIYIQTDVNGACLGEVIYGAGRRHDKVIYGTIGTGIGFGIYNNHQLIVAEGGHSLIHRVSNDRFAGTCPYHKDCLESLASGPAMEKRWQIPAECNTNVDAWYMEAEYLAQGITNIAMFYNPEIIILGGGVMHHDGLLEMIQEKVHAKINGYILEPVLMKPQLGDDAGLYGAIALAKGEGNGK